MRSSRGRPTGLAEQFCADDNKKKGAETRPNEPAVANAVKIHNATRTASLADWSAGRCKCRRQGLDRSQS